MSAAHTPTRHYWNTGAEPSKYVFVGGAKPINAGSIERAQQICRACNAHDELVAALAACDAAITCGNFTREHRLLEAQKAVRAALAKVQA